MIKIGMMAIMTAIAVLLGIRRGRRVVDREPTITLASAHQHLPEALTLLPISILFSILAVAVFSNYQALWLLPPSVDPWSLPVLYVCSAGFLLYIASAAVQIAYRSAHAERHKLAVASGLLLTAFGLIYVRHSVPVYPHLQDTRTPEGFILQTSPYTCGPASAANILALRGVSTTEREMARLTGTTDLGTSPGEIIRALRLKGVPARKAMLTMAQLLQLPLPAILLVDYPGMGPMSHAIVLEKFEGDNIHVIDPLNGRERLSTHQLKSQWRGHVIRVMDEA